MSSNAASLIIAVPEIDSNLYYECKFLAPDPIIYFKIDGRKSLVLSDLELDRARDESSVHSVLSHSSLLKKIAANPHPHRTSATALAVHHLFKKKGVRKIFVPANFPAQYLDELRRLKYRVIIKPDPFIDARLVKSNLEKKYIKNAIAKVGRALHEALLILEKSKIRGEKIYVGKEIVTSELLKQIIDQKLLGEGCEPGHLIVASGRQGSFPHHHGSGPIRPHTPIIFDIFPKDLTTRYWADMTRTVIKGKPSTEVKKMYQAVLAATRKATKKVRSGIMACTVHEEAKNTLESFGFKTGNIKGRIQGFIHSTGHGLGLDIHELPSVSTRKDRLQSGNVITIEPGLYYPKLGGIRIEDVVYVKNGGYEPLTNIPKFFEIDRA